MKSAWMLIPMVAIVAAPAARAEEARRDPKAAQQAKEKAEAAIRGAINATAKAIDRCTQQYVAEKPEASGQARIEVKVAKDGWVTDATAQTALPEARTLRACLENVAKRWRFPKPRQPTSMGLTVPVAEGVEFKVPSPEERKKMAEQAKKRKKKPAPEGFLRLQAGTFLPVFSGQGPGEK